MPGVALQLGRVLALSAMPCVEVPPAVQVPVIENDFGAADRPTSFGREANLYVVRRGLDET
jgi:hypothetical protein